MYYFFILSTFILYSFDGVIGKELCPNVTKMVECVKNAENHWKNYRNDKKDFKSWCCLRWDAYNCQLDVGKHCEGDYDKNIFGAQMDASLAEIQEVCKDIPQDKCSGLKWWAITLKVIACLAVIAILAFLVFALFSRNRRRYSAKKIRIIQINCFKFFVKIIKFISFKIFYLKA
jgi:hypothetical protein